MISFKEVCQLLVRRYRNEPLRIFAARVLRLGIISLYVPAREIKAHRVKSSRFELVVIKVNDYKMCVDTKDDGISTDLILDGTRESYIATKWKDKIRENDVVIDIGANIGYYVIPEAKRCKTLYAIEPIEKNIELLEKNIKLNKLDNVDVYNYAIGNSCRDDVINVSRERNMCSMIKKKGYRNYIGTQNIQTVTLDEFLKDKLCPTVLRMDTEGYELEILQGASKLMSGSKPLKMFIEVHFDILMNKTKLLIDILKKAGFEITCASYECSPFVVNHKIGERLTGKLEKVLGHPHGYLDLKLDNLYERKYKTGQVEYLEVIVER